MNVPKKVKAMPWPEEWKSQTNQDVIVTLDWPVVDHERLMVVTFRRNTGKRCYGTRGPDVRLVCSKKRNRAAMEYRGGSRPKKRADLEEAVGAMCVSVGTCYPEITPEDEAALAKWLGAKQTMNHMLPELSRWVEDAMEQEREAEARARGELEDDEVTRLCPDELPEGLVEYIRNTVLPQDRVLLYKKGNARGTCFVCGRQVYAKGRRFRQDNAVTCPDCGAAVVAYLETSDRYKANYVQDLVTIQRGTDGTTLFLRQWHLCRDYTAKWENIADQLEEVARYGIRGNRVAKWQIEKKETWYMNAYRYRLKDWERVKNVTEVYDGIYQFFLPPNWREILQGTSLKYCDLGGYVRERELARREADHRGNPVRFLLDWARYPAMEKLWKAGYTELIHDRMTGQWRTKKHSITWTARTIQDAVHLPLHMLRLKKPAEWTTKDVAKLVELRGMAVDGVIQEREAMELFTAGVEIDNVKQALGHATVHKVVKYVEKLVAAEEARKDAAAEEAKKKHMPYYRGPATSPQTYRDYLADCVRLNLNLDDREVLFPADLEAAHQRTIAQVRYQANKEARKKFEKQVKKLESMAWERDGLLIRPARTPGELTAEGKALHHCVGGYADRMAAGETVILFIRKAEEPDTPFYTLEYRNGVVVQCRTNRNATYEQDEAVKNFVDAWVEQVAKKDKGRKKAATAA